MPFAETPRPPQREAARRGFYVIYKDKALLSRIDPEGQAERVSSGLPLKERTLYLCPSPLLGYGLRTFLRRLPHGSALLCVEADKALYDWTLENIDSALLEAPDFVFAHCGQSADLCGIVRKKWGERYFRRAAPLNISGGRLLYESLYDDFETDLNRMFAFEWANALTLARLGRLYIKNLFKNIPLLKSSPFISDIDSGGAPVLVMGAGPSLNAVLEALDPKNPPFIAAVDTALPSLASYGIRPRVAVSLESQHWNLDDFSGWGVFEGQSRPGTSPPALAMDLSASNAASRLKNINYSLDGEEPFKPYFFSTVWTGLKIFSRLKDAGLLPPALPPLGSVGLCAVELALRITSAPVAVCGLDFSFTVDSYHARGSPSHKAALRRAGRFGGLYHTAAVFREGSAPGAGAPGRRRTDPAMRRYKALFEERFGENSRVFRIESAFSAPGSRAAPLPLKKALELLAKNGRPAPGLSSAPGSRAAPRRAGVQAFIDGERRLLEELRRALTGRAAPEDRPPDFLIDCADYLWAHFPDCAGAGGRRPSLCDTSFLKRVRAEIDSFISLLMSAHNNQ